MEVSASEVQAKLGETAEKLKEEVKNAIPVVKPADPPSLGQPEGSMDTKIDVSSMEMIPYIKHVALWKDPKLSAKFLFLISVVFYYTGEEGYGMGTFLCLALLERTIIAYGLTYGAQVLKAKENNLVKKLGDGFQRSADLFISFTKIPDSYAVNYWCDGINNYVKKKITSAFSKIEKAENDTTSLKIVAAHLFGFFMMFAIFSVRTLIFITVYVGLLVPPVYVRYSDKIDPVVDSLKEKLKPHLEVAKEKISEISDIVFKKVDEISAQVNDKIAEVRKGSSAAGNEKKDN